MVSVAYLWGQHMPVFHTCQILTAFVISTQKLPNSYLPLKFLENEKP